MKKSKVPERTVTAIIEDTHPGTPLTETQVSDKVSTEDIKAAYTKYKNKLEEPGVPPGRNAPKLYAAKKEGKPLRGSPNLPGAQWIQWEVNSTNMEFNSMFTELTAQLRRLSEDSPRKRLRSAKRIFGTVDPLLGVISKEWSHRRLNSWKLLGFAKLIRLCFSKKSSSSTK
jgi:hypothetical protein